MSDEPPNEVFTKEFLYYYCHPTTAKETIRYEYLKHSHCHRCPESIDCDVEDFLSCEIPKHKNFNKCTCFLCIGKNKLRKIIESEEAYRGIPKVKKRRYEEPDYYEDTFLETNI